MNHWTKESFKLANERDYLDQLYKVYPCRINKKRKISKDIANKLSNYHNSREDKELIKTLFKAPSFPISDSYISFIRQDFSAMDRNPKTIKRITGYLYDMELSEVLSLCEKPAVSSRQMGSLFRNWVSKETLGFTVYNSEDEFLSKNNDAILCGSDTFLKNFASKYLGYKLNKGLDLIARINNTYIVGEAKFLTATGGAQNNQFRSAMILGKHKFPANKLGVNVTPVVIIDGISYIKNRTVINTELEENNDIIVLSALLLREFLNSI